MFKRFRTTLVIRVTFLIVSLSMIIISLVGTALYSQLSNGIFKEKLNLAISDAQSVASSTQLQIALAQFQDAPTAKLILSDLLSSPSTSANYSGREIAIFPVAHSGSNPSYHGTSNQVLESSIPKDFRAKIRKSKTYLWDNTTINYQGGNSERGLVIGQLLNISTAGKYELYVMFNLTQQGETINLIKHALFLTGLVLTLLIGLITWLVLRQLIAPVREAARIAEELTAGDLDQRMIVNGEDEIARLGYAFNEMAVSLKQQISRLENLSRLQQRFVSDVSHELRTPLTTMRMAAQVIFNAKTAFEPALARSSELLLSQIERFEGLLTDLLEVSRFDAEAAVVELQDIDIVELVRQAVDYVHPSQERIIRITVLNVDGTSSGPIMVVADKRRIDRVIRNLLTNALDHHEGKPIDVTIADTDNEVAVAVRDYGIGFNQKDRASLFDRFWRADPSRARTRGGTGLGLSIALEDAKLHQGTLEAWGAPGNGANFVLTLPKHAGGIIKANPIELIPDSVTH
jgi:two-component system, OmpR family, sensor histidine kinase MtrB